MRLALLAAIALLLGCGGGKTTASKSAAAFDEAKKTAVPVAAAQAHAEADHASMPAMDHSAMPSMDHSKMNHAQMDHSQMDHSTMPAMQHMQHGSSASAPTPRPNITAPPAISTTSDPAATLRPDEFDAPAPSAVGEAAKTAAPPAHHHHGGGS